MHTKRKQYLLQLYFNEINLAHFGNFKNDAKISNSHKARQ